MADFEYLDSASKTATAPNSETQQFEYLDNSPSSGIDYSSLQSNAGQEQKVPINPGDAYNIGSIRTPEYKAKYVKGLFQGSDVSIGQDNRIKVTSPQGSEMFIEPHRHGFINAIKDNATKLMEFVGDQGLPIAGQIAADASTASTGVGMAGMMGANAAGAMAGRGIQQAYNNQLVGEPYSGSDAVLQGAAGAASVPISAAVEPVLRQTASVLGKGVTKLVGTLGNAAPSVAESLFGVPHMNTEWLVDQMKAGRSAADIFGRSLENASPERAGQIVRNLLFGDKNSKGLPEDFMKQYQRLHGAVAGDAGKVGVLDEFFSKSLGLDKDTLDVLKTKSVSELMSPAMTDPKAWRTLADNAIGSIDHAQSDLQAQYGSILKSVIENTNDKTLNVKPFVDELKAELQKLRIVDDLTLNKNYNGDAAKKAYSTVLDKFGEILSRDKKMLPKGLGGGTSRARGGGLTAGELQDLINRGVEARVNGKKVKMTPFNISNMRLSDIRNIKAETKPLFNRLFEGTGLSQEEKRPLAQFLNRLDSAIEQVPGTQPLTAINQRYAKFQDAKDLFHTLGYGGLSEQQGVISTLKQSLSKDPATRATNQSYLADLDNMLGKNKILPQLKTLGASQDARFADYNGTEKKLIGQMRSIHQSGTSQDMQRQAADLLKTVDNAVQPRAYKFYNDMRDHLTAEAYSSNRQNVFKVRYLETLLGSSLLTAGHPMLGALGVLGGLNVFSPAGIGKGIMAGENALGAASSGTLKAVSDAGKAAVSPGGRAALASILRKKTGL